MGIARKKAELRQAFDVSEEGDYTAICAGDIYGFIPEACELVFRGDNKINSALGTVDGDRFLEYLEYYLCPTLGNYARGEPRSLVIIDNVRFHQKLEVKRLINATGAELLFTARYSPDKNPIEYYFSVYKQSLKRYLGSISALKRHQACITCVSEETARNTFAHCGYPLVEKNDVDGAVVAAVLAALQYFD